MRYKIVFTKHAQKDALKIKNSVLKEKIKNLISILRENPFQNLPPYEKLVADLSGAYSRRINIKHRLVYHVLENEKVVKILRMWTHYE